MWRTLIQNYYLVAVPFYVLCAVIVVTMIYEERDPSTTLAWVLVFVALPWLGFVLFLLVGRDPRLAGTRDKSRILTATRGREVMAPRYAPYRVSAKAFEAAQPPIVARLARALCELSGTEPLPCTDLAVHTKGAEMFDQLYRDIEAAADHVHLEYYSWEDDELTRRFCDLLGEKARSGVEVRVLYDWLGSIRYGKTQLRALRAAGASVRADAARVQRLDYRNHRKIAVVDGRIAYTGGVNFGQEYIDGGKRFASWRDTSIRFGGPLVAELQRLFAMRWMRVTAEDVFGPRYFPELRPDGASGQPVWGQLAFSGAESRWESIHHAYITAIGSAQRRVRVQSPYFVPDQALVDSLVAQSFAGVDVELMMAGVPDKKLPWWAAFTYFDRMLDAGGAVFHFEAGFFHPKTMTVDGAVTVIGTANFDIRSFVLNDELSLFFYDEGVTARQDAIFDADLALCRQVTATEVAGLAGPVRLRNALARLVSRLL
jgi:cardiolipin synthase A/B